MTAQELARQHCMDHLPYPVPTAPPAMDLSELLAFLHDACPDDDVRKRLMFHLSLYLIGDKAAPLSAILTGTGPTKDALVKLIRLTLLDLFKSRSNLQTTIQDAAPEQTVGIYKRVLVCPIEGDGVVPPSDQKLASWRDAFLWLLLQTL